LSFEELWPYDGIDVKIRIDYDVSVPASLFVDTIKSVESAFFIHLEQQLKFVAPDLAKQYNVDLEYILNEFYKLQGNGLVITKVQSGSAILFGAISGLCVWVLANTLGESFKEAWKKSETHEKLKEFFKKDLFDRRKRVKDEIEIKLKLATENNAFLKNSEIDVSEDAYDSGMINVTISLNSGEILEEYGGGYENL
jgi:hypothetical protein